MIIIKNVIAIDGPAGAGKSTIARKLAQKLGYKHLDTGSMYRAVTLLAIKKNIDINDSKQLTTLAQNIDISFTPADKNDRSSVLVNNKDVTNSIRKPIVDQHVSEIARISGVRKALIKQQREIAKNGNIIMDGRDIGSRVLPGADLKIYLTASVKERARRRFEDRKDTDENIKLKEIKKEIIRRDKIDKNREESPLIKTDDAYCINTTNKSIKETIDIILSLIKEGE